MQMNLRKSSKCLTPIRHNMEMLKLCVKRLTVPEVAQDIVPVAVIISALRGVAENVMVLLAFAGEVANF